MAIHGAAWHSAFPKTLFKLFECVWVLFYSICSALCPHLLHLTFCDSRFITKIPVWNCHSCLTWGLIQNLKSIVLTFRSIAAYQTRRTRTYTHGCLRAVHFARSVDNLLSSAHDQSQSRNIVFYLVFFNKTYRNVSCNFRDEWGENRLVFSQWNTFYECISFQWMRKNPVSPLANIFHMLINDSEPIMCEDR